MRIVVIGGSGHIGTYLIPRLIRAGHHVINVSRNKSRPYQADPVWSQVEQVYADRASEEVQGRFGSLIKALEPDVVIDMICFTLDSAEQLVESLEGHIQHFISCGTIWVHGPSAVVPATENQPRNPFGEYGIQKARIERYLLEKARKDGFPATVLHPGHIVGPGWVPLNPSGHFNPDVFAKLANGEEILIPNIGMETIHHVHADDLAQCFFKAIYCWNDAVGESFHIVSPAAVTLRGYAEEAASWFGRSANIKYVPWKEFEASVSKQDSEATWDHIAHSPNCSIEKAISKLDYKPRYSSFEAVRESVEWLILNDRIKVNN